MRQQFGWEVVVSLETKGTFPTFREAFKSLYDEVTKMILEEKMSIMCLEQATWITTSSGCPLPFYKARDLAISEGLLKDGKLVAAFYPPTVVTKRRNSDREEEASLWPKSRPSKKIQVKTRFKAS